MVRGGKANHQLLLMVHLSDGLDQWECFRCECFEFNKKLWVGQKSPSPISSECGLDQCELCPYSKREDGEFCELENNNLCENKCCEYDSKLNYLRFPIWRRYGIVSPVVKGQITLTVYHYPDV